MTKRSYAILWCLIWFQFFGQKTDSLTVHFKVAFDGMPLELNKTYCTAKKDSVAITAFKCYVSNLEIEYADKTAVTEKNSYHLLDLENPESLQIPIGPKNDKVITQITFNIGIDSITNTSGALNGDLDPIKGMYWAWQSGYINLKIEGHSPSCKTRKNQFQFHLGGYLNPYYALRKKVIAVNRKGDFTVNIDMAVFLGEINLAKTNSVMIPGKTAMDLADVASKMFFLE